MSFNISALTSSIAIKIKYFGSIRFRVCFDQIHTLITLLDGLMFLFSHLCIDWQTLLLQSNLSMFVAELLSSGLLIAKISRKFNILCTHAMLMRTYHAYQMSYFKLLHSFCVLLQQKWVFCSTDMHLVG